jgi:glutathione S-transferase
MQQIVSDRIRGANADMSGERSTLRTGYAMADQRMASRTWIAGTRFSMADCAAAPALFYASTVEPFADELVHLRAYFDRLAERPSFHRVLVEAKPYFSMYPFAESIPDRFR